ncbi:D-alanyl-D-alanine carboxypeptidase/D-alanyl-D-alanine-endopeptidase [Neobacillus sp. MM2021_6]|uniref:D-alanyl-D-alanine carboxypeptidase/D-alanyl-D-alanine endopeptidase n=1 Tax=Bacillaceae TaxID=186817 RepID=UPI00140BF6F8|nr:MULTISPECIES: D-alanyl-D-alanine carboxypeptidase/D-alanyl-D-alanine-endopeptidase [Bacillaceae]MBO0962235.1 D-alanyl-D-alanine carboxypeptidase/D-alanyl-D-alanine-endopeptidase [Neobacillus sp. MM2021_6]NHC18248.1 D-alanyl-D-alanine carboxypeptidase/D-alanyl-D-alanine-endopeptidase [Bacillus sp. MM2020_4]
MKRTKIYIIVFFVVISLAIPYFHVNGMNSHDNMGKRLNQLIVSEPDLQGTIAGISIRSAASGEIIYDHQGDIRLRPASNMKLLTAAAALQVLGEKYRFKTEVLSDAPLKKQTLEGNLFLKGYGDPTLLKSDFDKMAVELKELGIKRIKGNVVGDDSHYDNERYSLDLPWSDETTYYGAQISALTAAPTNDYDSGSVMVKIKPGLKSGDKVEVVVTPETNYVKIINKAETVEADGKKKIKVEREHAKNTITIEGTIPVTTKAVTEWIGVWDPTKYATTLFKQSLAKNGIKVSGKIRTGTASNTAKVLTSHQSMPLSELLIPFMKLSNNGHAEVLVKEMGKVVKGKGSWETGLEVLETEISKFGVNTKTMVIRDGSGVSHVDLIPANQITQLLFSVQKERWFPAYVHSLPVAGAPEKTIGGTLRYRLKDPIVQGKVKAKTGTISTVSSISGYVTTKNGHSFIFSILLNNLVNEEKAKKIEDRLIQLIANTY